MSTRESSVGLGRTGSLAPRAVMPWLLSNQRAVFLVLSVVAGALALVGRYNHGWFFHDDGSLAHSATRVLEGELPHRDFAELYTGALTFVNAGMFFAFGEDAINLRLPLLLLFGGFVGCFYALSTRLLRPAWAFTATLFAITWTVPVYAAPMPSWYLLFLSTIGLYSIVRYFEGGSSGWLLSGGLCGGVAVSVKVTGVWYVLAIVLALLVRPLLADMRGERTRDGRRLYANAVATSALLALCFVGFVMRPALGAGEFVALLLPVAALCGTVAVLAWRSATGASVRDERKAMMETGIFLAASAIPLALVSAPYILTGSLGDLMFGVLVAPTARYEFSSLSMPEPLTLLRAVPVVALLAVRPRLRESWRRLVDVAAVAVILVLVVTSGDQTSYIVLWGTARALAPYAILFAAVALVRRRPADGTRASVLLAIVLVGGLFTLNQFPFATPLYYCYVVPLLLLVGIVALQRMGLTAGILPGAALIALVAFGGMALDTQTSIRSLGLAFQRPPTSTLAPGRASIRVPVAEKRAYDRMTTLVAEHGGDGPIWAGPDAPDVYFLTRSENPTRVIMDFLDETHSTTGTRLLALLARPDINVVVVNHGRQQSPALDAQTLDRVRSMFGYGERVGRFEVRWRIA